MWITDLFCPFLSRIWTAQDGCLVSVSLAVMQIFILIWRIVTNCLKNYSAYESTIKPFWWIWGLCSLPPSSVGQCLPDVMVSNSSLLHISSSSVVLCHTSLRQRESLQSCQPSKEEMDWFIWAGKNSLQQRHNKTLGLKVRQSFIHWIVFCITSGSAWNSDIPLLSFFLNIKDILCHDPVYKANKSLSRVFPWNENCQITFF